ncbi:MAG: rhomboid family intramembrane serine protease [Bacteroidetes bacterium]|nr:rhomboid family intramembrane serine protease [Bacteroidota bacterium]
MSLTVLIVLVTISLSLYAFKSPEIMDKFIFSPSRVYKNKEFLRFLTSGFIHADYFHLFFNMLALYSFGQSLEVAYTYYFGDYSTLYFILLYVCGILVSNVPSFLKHKKDVYYSSLGASGAVSAVVFSCILFSPTSYICAFYFVCLPSFVFGLFYLIYTVYMARNNNYSRINHWAHLIGAIFGLVFNTILEPKIILSFFYQVKRFIMYQ